MHLNISFAKWRPFCIGLNCKTGIMDTRTTKNRAKTQLGSLPKVMKHNSDFFEKKKEKTHKLDEKVHWNLFPHIQKAILSGCAKFHRWIPSQRPMTQSFDVFFPLYLNKQLKKKTIVRLVISRHRAHYDVTVMKIHNKKTQRVYFRREFQRSAGRSGLNVSIYSSFLTPNIDQLRANQCRAISPDLQHWCGQRGRVWMMPGVAVEVYGNENIIIWLNFHQWLHWKLPACQSATMS